MNGLLLVAAVLAAGDVSFKGAWKEGARHEWPGVHAKTAVQDWRGYDRLVMDVTNLADDGDVISLVVTSPDTPRNEGPRTYLRAPAWETVRWEMPIAYFEDGQANVTNVVDLHFYSHRPKGVNVTISGMRLLKKGEAAPPVETPVALRKKQAQGRADYVAREAEARAAFVASLRAANERDGVQSARILYGAGSGMAQVRPKKAMNFSSARAINVRLARNEWEGRQVFVTPAHGALKDVQVRVSALKLKEPWYRALWGGTYFPSADVKVSVIGYVKTTRAPRYGVGYSEATNAAPGYVRKTKKADLGWWPDLLLDYLTHTDVAAGDTQGFWISVHAGENQAAGVYEGTVTISAQGEADVQLPIAVRVNNFTLPKTPVIPTLVSFTPCVYVARDHKNEHAVQAEQIKRNPMSPLNLWKKHELQWADFWADHFITPAPLYHHGFDLPWATWEHLAKEGRMGYFNLSYFSVPYFKGDESLATNKKFQAWNDWVVSVIKRNYATAQQHGLADKALVYCCDEAGTNRFPIIDKTIARMKAKLPPIPFLTTSYDDDFGTAQHLRQMDWFCPQPHKMDVAKAEKSRAAGHKVWWYFACDQRAPSANIFTECPPVEIRQLMGAAAAKYRPDGFLYYQCAYFNNDACVTGGPYTAWNPRSWWNEHGDATWVGVGPDGVPLSTIRLENFRDGFEDLAYAKLLEAKTGRRVDVPRAIHDTLTNFSDEDAALEKWRAEMADALEN